MQIVAEPELQTFVERELLKQQSPAAIAGRLATGRDGLSYVSKNSIYRYIDSVYGRQLEYQLLRLKQQRKAGHKRQPLGERLQDRTFIDDRPTIISARQRVGDLEADFIVSGKSGTGYLLTAVDRKLRYGFIRKLLPVTIINMEQAFLEIKKVFPELTSITTDNDLLFRYHERLEALLEVPIYFCHPYHSWEKGSVENYNGQVRKYIRKGADISQYSLEYLTFVTTRLNSRFMSVLDHLTPQECLDEYRQSLRNKKPH